MTLPQAPKGLFWLCVAGLFLYEGWALYTHVAGQPGNTISEMFWRGELNPNYGPLLSWAFGCLCGHLFWQRKV